MEPSQVRDADEVRALGSALLGVDPALATGVVQPMATWTARDGTRYALKILDSTPRSENDFFLLNLARARSEAILTTGAILRAEPGVTHALGGPGAVPEALAAWRRNTLGLKESPLLVVLSSGRDLAPGHPAFRAPVRPVLFVPESAAAGLAKRFGTSAEVASADTTGSREAVAWLRARGIGRITVEGGPTSTLPLYQKPGCVDELWRSTYLEHELLDRVIGARVDVPDEADVVETTGGKVVSEASGDWRFERLRLR